MNDYIPGYLEGIQDDLKTITEAAERAAAYIENGPTYQKRQHPHHAAAVNTYNKLVTILLTVQPLQIEDEIIPLF